MPLAKGPYKSENIEPEIINYWLENKFFKPEYHPEKGLLSEEEMKQDSRDSFAIINPPPNAYMRPHIGNVSGYAYQDVFLRFNRLLGKKVLGQPGKDHAGIQGEVLVESIFIKNKGKNKQELGRDKFYHASYAHFEKLMPKIMADEQRIGLSSDYDRNLFTLDPKVVDTVLGTFTKMYEDKMVYKGVRIVNWDPVAQTTLADIDTERVERETDLVYIKYPLVEPKGKITHITVATTRAETMLGDTAVVVDPKDERYQDLVGTMVKLPLTNREIPIITSPRIDKEFGTGALKLTPSHAYEDYVIMNEWNEANPDNQIGYINVVNKAAELCGPIPEKYLGMKTEKAREQVIADLQEQDFIEKIEKHTQNVVIGERSKAVIEPIMSSQWFIDVERLKQPAIDAVKNGKVKIHPDYMTKKYLHWMENLHDWPVSRSLWWGYRIPVWYKGELTETIDENGQVKETISGQEVTGIYDAVEKGLAKVQLDPPGLKITVVRHGETDDNLNKIYAGVTDTPLNETGKKQAEEFASQLTATYDLVLTSPLARAKQTATIVADKLGVELIEEKLIQERDFGELEGLTWEQFNEQYPELAAKNNPDYQVDLPGGETIEQTTARIEGFIKEFSSNYADKKVLIVTHSGIIRILKRILNNDSANATRRNDAANLDSIEFIIPEAGWIQDPDVFDTWFSSGQWPYATLSANNLMDTFYPSDIMETGYDILELWVSRMIMLGLYTQGEVPFKDVYLHGLVKAPDGQKMSKSKGNVIAPEDIINEYGADALRLLYIVGNKAGAGYPVDYDKLMGYKRFLNKIWNASKFTLGMTSDLDQEHLFTDLTDADKISTDTADQKLLEHIKQISIDVREHIEKFRIGLAAELLYQDFWHTFCDEYLEEVKPRVYSKDQQGNPIERNEAEIENRRMAQRTLLTALKYYMTMLHPFIPFITEHIWQQLPKMEADSETVMYGKWL